MSTAIKSLIAVVVILSCSREGFSQWTIDVEGNYVVGIPNNTVRIPAATGTTIDLAEDLDPETTVTFRARLSYTIRERHVISALVAPLTIHSSGRLNREVRYSDRTFAANTDIDATYRFDSYRLTYRYLFVAKDNLKFGAGISAKIRDANITLENTSGSADYPNTGFVPLINFYFQWKPGNQWSVLLEGDALGTKQGRAEDIFAGITFNLLPKTEIKAGYRVLEGGADVTDNYNFAFVNYAALGLLISL